MTPEQFNSFALDDRAQILWKDGQFLETIPYYGFAVQLYSLCTFFVEVYYNDDEKKIESIKSVSEDDLKKYLGRIKIDTF